MKRVNICVYVGIYDGVYIYTVTGRMPVESCEPPKCPTSEICPSRTTLVIPSCEWNRQWQGRHLLVGT